MKLAVSAANNAEALKPQIQQAEKGRMTKNKLQKMKTMVEPKIDPTSEAVELTTNDATFRLAQDPDEIDTVIALEKNGSQRRLYGNPRLELSGRYAAKANAAGMD